jgi:MFS family permease
VAQTFAQMMALSIFFGLLRSSLYGHSSAVVADLFYQAYGSNGVLILALFPYGIGVLVGAPLSGGLYDVTGDYILSLLVIAAIFLCAALVFLSLEFRRRCVLKNVCRSSRQATPAVL